MTGRPNSFSPEIANAICERIAGSESLKSICRDEDMPSESTVRNWLARGSKAESQEDEFAAFLRQYAHAREAQADTDADEVGDIGRKTLAGEYDPQAARVAIDALKWSAGKRAPKKYGERVTQEHTGEGGGPIAIAWKIIDPNA